jgi:hypothetical protein
VIDVELAFHQLREAGGLVERVPDECHACDVAKIEQRIVDVPPLPLCTVERFLE